MKVAVPPLKCQGIKTKLVAWIVDHVSLNGGPWIEPFMGSDKVFRLHTRAFLSHWSKQENPQPHARSHHLELRSRTAAPSSKWHCSSKKENTNFAASLTAPRPITDN